MNRDIAKMTPELAFQILRERAKHWRMSADRQRFKDSLHDKQLEAGTGWGSQREGPSMEEFQLRSNADGLDAIAGLIGSQQRCLKVLADLVRENGLEEDARKRLSALGGPFLELEKERDVEASGDAS